MDSDLILIAGVILAALAVPSVISAFSSGTPPRRAAVLAVAGGALIVVAAVTHPGGYSPAEIPQVVKRVADRYLY
jgi:hypothetical protein